MTQSGSTRWCQAQRHPERAATTSRSGSPALFQKPMSPLPYLFFYSAEQNTGKSIFHEALAELVTKGVARADEALTNPPGSTASWPTPCSASSRRPTCLESKVAYNRIKDWVCSRKIPIHVKGLTPYTIPNSTHWLHCANGGNGQTGPRATYSPGRPGGRSLRGDKHGRGMRRPVLPRLE